MKLSISTSMLIAALLVSSTAFAKGDTRRISEKRVLRSSGALYVSNVSGTVRISGIDEEMMYLSGELEEGVEDVEISGEGDDIRIRVEMHKRNNNGGSADLEIRVPRNARIEVRCVSADIELKDVTGVANLQSVSGEITIGGELKTIELKSVSGNIRVNGVGERLIAESVSGDIRVVRAIGEAELETVSGDMTIEAGRVTRFRAKSVSGDVEFRGDVSGTGHSDIESHSGDVTLELGDRSDASFEIHTFSGEIRGGADDGKKRARFSVGKGTARVGIHTFSGDIRVRVSR